MLLLLLFAAAAVAAPPAFRLPDTVQPVRYAVELKLTPPDEDFSGVADIEVTLREPASTIWLHGVGLTVGRATVNGAEAWVESAGEFLGLTPARAAAAGPAKLHIEYRGKLSRNSSDGLFLNQQAGDWYVFTQFEPVSARRAFPCFDEPRFKTPWQLTLRVPKQDRAFANTPQIAESDGADGLKTVRFAESKPLPSYLVAVAVGPIEVVDGGRAGKNQVPVRILATRGRAAAARYAARVTGEIVNRLEAFFGIPYPYEKLDSVAIPLVFGFGAMENAGLITYAQNLILADPGAESVDFQRTYAKVAAHEIAHQWFGDLVTLAWWDDTWLNEAFATWTEQEIVAEWHPEWGGAVSDVFSKHGAMEQDSLVSARRIRQPIASDSDIVNAFDGITYQKGAAVIRMFQRWVGPDRFRKGVRSYLERHAWGNATSADFLADVSEGSGRNIAPAFSTFLDQAGLPLVTAALQCGSNPTVTLAQKRFLPLGSPGAPPATWQIPVCVQYPGGRECTVLNSAKAELKLNTSACPDWINANAEESGYYRVLYQGDLLPKLLDGGGRRLSLVERVGVLGDVEALLGAGQAPARGALGLVPEFSGDPDRNVVEAAIDLAASVADHMVPDDLRPNYARFVRRAFGARARELGWQSKPGENDDARLLRPVLVGFVAREGEDRELAGEAGRLARAWIKDRSAVAPDTIASVLETAANFGDAALFDALHSAARAEKNPRDRQRMIDALGEFRDPALARRALGLILSGEFDARETIRLGLLPLRNAETRDLPFELVKAHYDELLARLPRGISADAGASLPDVAEGFCSLARRDEVQAFFEPRMAKITGGPRNLAQVLESIQICAAVKQAQEPGVAEFLKTF